MIDFLFEKVLIPLMIIGLITGIPYAIYIDHKETAELKTILKNECGMEYSQGEVWRNGKNLSRICGMKNN